MASFKMYKGEWRIYHFSREEARRFPDFREGDRVEWVLGDGKMYVREAGGGGNG